MGMTHSPAAISAQNNLPSPLMGEGPGMGVTAELAVRRTLRVHPHPTCFAGHLPPSADGKETLHLEHRAEKWIPVFRKNDAKTKI
jgi:hypothetical protein